MLRIGRVVFCLFAAIGCYAFGIPAGGIAFLFIGFVFEALFWFGIFGKKKKYWRQNLGSKLVI